jgi:hypothetical protein
MNMEIGTEAALFPEKEYISGIFLAVWKGRKTEENLRGRKRWKTRRKAILRYVRGWIKEGRKREWRKRKAKVEGGRKGKVKKRRRREMRGRKGIGEGRRKKIQGTGKEEEQEEREFWETSVERPQNGKKSEERGRRKVKGSWRIGKEGKGNTRRGKVGTIIELKEALQGKKEREIVLGYLVCKKAVWVYGWREGGRRKVKKREGSK